MQITTECKYALYSKNISNILHLKIKGFQCNLVNGGGGELRPYKYDLMLRQGVDSVVMLCWSVCPTVCMVNTSKAAR